MPKLIMLYDPEDKINGLHVEERRRFNIMEATLSVPKGLDGRDIYALARKLSELLLEQVGEKA